MIRFAMVAAPLMLSQAAPLVAQQEITDPVEPGEYRDRSSFEAFHGLRLNADGTYQWLLSVGALDQRSSGTWERVGSIAVLTTTPPPVAPEIRRDADDPSPDAPFVLVRRPDGQGIGGIDLKLVCADGKQIIHYTQDDGWNLRPGECEAPFTLNLSEPVYDVGPFSFEIEPGERGLRFTLVPNDFGVKDLTGTGVAAHDGGIVFFLSGTRVKMERLAAE